MDDIFTVKVVDWLSCRSEENIENMGLTVAIQIFYHITTTILSILANY